MPDSPITPDIRIGTVRDAVPHPRSRVPAIVMTIDFGPILGHKTTSAQLTENYEPDTLVGTQVTAIVNLPPKRVAGIKSDVLVLGARCPTSGTVLIRPLGRTCNGTPAMCIDDGDEHRTKPLV